MIGLMQCFIQKDGTLGSKYSLPDWEITRGSRADYNVQYLWVSMNSIEYSMYSNNLYEKWEEGLT